MGKPKSTRGGRTARALRVRNGPLTSEQIAYRYLRTTADRWRAIKLEYFLTVYLEAWDAPERHLEALAAELCEVQYGPLRCVFALEQMHSAKSLRHVVLDRAALLLGSFLDDHKRRARREWPLLCRALDSRNGRSLLAAIGSTLDQLLEGAR